jgi:arsenate reductase
MKLLFICTHNRCRSILSEAITNHFADGRVIAYSAGSQPAGQVHPLTLKYLSQRGMAIDGLKSQSWDEFAEIAPDVVITVCDSAASEACPIWFGDVIKVHWGLLDPSKMTGSEQAVQAAFYAVMDTIEQRTRAMLALNLAALSASELKINLTKLALEA